MTGVERMFAIEARMLRADAGDRDEFEMHAVLDVWWLLRRCNQMFSLLSPEEQARFADGPE